MIDNIMYRSQIGCFNPQLMYKTKSTNKQGWKQQNLIFIYMIGLILTCCLTTGCTDQIATNRGSQHEFSYGGNNNRQDGTRMDGNIMDIIKLDGNAAPIYPSTGTKVAQTSTEVIQHLEGK